MVCWSRRLSILGLFFLALSGRAEITLPPIDTTNGYVARLLINEVPFPGERGWVSEADSKAGMRQILLVLIARVQHVPPHYTQRQIAAVQSNSIIDIMTAGGVHGQVEGFYRNTAGQPVVAERVTTRINYLLATANKGAPGRFARLLSYATELAARHAHPETIDPDFYADLRRIRDTRVTGRAYSWMTDAGMFHPGGHFIRIPDEYRGGTGANRFYSLLDLTP